ncbi:hypothetical protein [Actinocorallia aurea]
MAEAAAVYAQRAGDHAESLPAGVALGPAVGPREIGGLETEVVGALAEPVEEPSPRRVRVATPGARWPEVAVRGAGG